MNGRYAAYDLDPFANPAAASYATAASASASASSSTTAPTGAPAASGYRRTDDYESFGLLDQSPLGPAYNPTASRTGNITNATAANNNNNNNSHSNNGSNNHTNALARNLTNSLVNGNINSSRNTHLTLMPSTVGRSSNSTSTNNLSIGMNMTGTLGNNVNTNTNDANAALANELLGFTNNSSNNNSNGLAHGLEFDSTVFSISAKRRQQQQQQQQQRQQRYASSSVTSPQHQPSMGSYAASMFSTQQSSAALQSRYQQLQHLQQQQQKQQDLFTTVLNAGNTASLSAANTPSAAIVSISNSQRGSSNGSKSKPNPDEEDWLKAMQVQISGLSLEPLTGTDILRRLREKTDDVSARYLPCVDFLVACQQELRKGLAAATQKRVVHNMYRDAMTPRQFYSNYISPLPERFYRKHKRNMTKVNLDASVKEIYKLVAEAKAAERQGCENMKNTFLGGMKDGESWGLRKWLSKNGGALHICNDCECILHAVQKLDRSDSATSRIANRLRPLAKKALARLKSEVPTSYQEVSTAHPYLPFFHRLESALRGLSTFDPDDDDVICIDDDDEITEIKSAAPPPKPKGRKRPRSESGKESEAPPSKRALAPPPPPLSQSDDDSIIEILDMKPAAASGESTGRGSPFMDGDFLHFFSSVDDDIAGTTEPFEQELTATSAKRKEQTAASAMARASTTNFTSQQLAMGMDRLADLLDSGSAVSLRPSSFISESFWDGATSYQRALRIFANLLRHPDAQLFAEDVDELSHPGYSRVIKHPLCFQNIVLSLIDDFDDQNRTPAGQSGWLKTSDLKKWNMWEGLDLLQAIDLVILNSLAYRKAMGEGRSEDRTKATRLRKKLWFSVKTTLDSYDLSDEQKRQYTPTKRGETSGFVVYKQTIGKS